MRRSRSGCSSAWCSPLLQALFAGPPRPRRVTDRTVGALRLTGRQGRHPITFGCEVAHTFGEIWRGVFGAGEATDPTAHCGSKCAVEAKSSVAQTAKTKR